MPIIPLKNIAKLGTITDGSPASLPLEAFSMMANVRCHDGVIERGPVFRHVGDFPKDPRHIVSYVDANQTSRVFVAKRDGTVSELGANGVETDRTAAGWTPANSEAGVTSTLLNGVLYLNRSDRTLWYRAVSATGSFARLETYNSGNGFTQFPASHRFRSIRECGGVLVGINTSINGNSFPTMVTWSNFASDWQAPPADWDQANPTSSAGSNILAEMRGDLVDGAKLGQTLILYGTEETWAMEPTYNDTMFSWRRLHDHGVANINCVVEVNGVHYVFGDRDLYISDGLSVKSIASGRVRDFVFENLVSLEKYRTFVHHNASENSVYFCYVSNDRYCHFPYGSPLNNPGVNRIAAYNYANDTWTFLDVPYISHAGRGVIASGLTYDSSSPITYEQIGGSYATQGDEKSVLLMLSNGWKNPADGSTVSAAVRSFESYQSAATSAIDPVATAPVMVEKLMIDLDEIQAELSQYKLLSSIVIQAELSIDSLPLVFTVGSMDHPTEPITWGPSQTFDHVYQKLDHNIAGRYVTLKMTYGDHKDFKFIGMDCDVRLLGRR